MTPCLRVDEVETLPTFSLPFSISSLRNPDPEHEHEREHERERDSDDSEDDARYYAGMMRRREQRPRCASSTGTAVPVAQDQTRPTVKRGEVERVP